MLNKTSSRKHCIVGFILFTLFTLIYLPYDSYAMIDMPYVHLI